MAGVFGFGAPEPPNPATTASAQTSANISTAIANAYLNNANQVTPTGSLTYTPSGDSTTINDPAGVQYTIPRFLTTQTLNEPYASTERYRAEAQLRLAGLADTGALTLQGLLNHGVDLGQAPAPGNPDWLFQTANPATQFGDTGSQQGTFGAAPSQLFQFGATPGQQFGFDPTQGLQSQFGEAGGLTSSYGPGDFSADRSRVEQALYGRLQPQLELDRSRLEQQLADQGIRYGTPAYDQAMRQLNQQQTDARLAVTQTAGQEQQRMMDMAAKRAGFENAAQQQQYEQALGRGTFTNTAAQAAFGQAQARGQFANQAAAQAYAEAQGRGTFYNQAAEHALAEAQARGQFANAAQLANYQQALGRGTFTNAGLAQQQQRVQTQIAALERQRNQYLAEQYALRNQPLNEISALLSGSQVSQQPWASYNQSQIPTTDIAGLINQNFQQQFQNYNTQTQAQSQLLGGALGAAGNIGLGLALKSDRRSKENIHRIGTVFATEDFAGEESDRKKLPIYKYSYKDDPSSTTHVGPMAQDVEKIDPSAVLKDRRGVKYLNMPKTMGAILRAA
jgi:Chaperone of endosialidase